MRFGQDGESTVDLAVEVGFAGELVLIGGGVVGDLFEFFDERGVAPAAGDITSAVSRDRRQPGGKFFRVAHPPARLPRFQERILDDVLRFRSLLQHSVGNGEEGAAVRADDQLESLAISSDRGAVNISVSGVHAGVLTSLDARPRESARKIFCAERAAGALAEPPRYQIYDIGVIQNGDSSSEAFGLSTGMNGAINFGGNEDGAIVGSSMLNQGPGLPFIASVAGQLHAIPLPIGATEGVARSVNTSGWAVGTASSGLTIPFLYDGTITYRLADLIPSDSGWDLVMNTSSSAVGISDNGTIVGTGVQHGETHAFAMVPVSGVPSLCGLCHKRQQTLSLPCESAEYKRHIGHGDFADRCGPL